jgi:hypothetical protein
MSARSGATGSGEAPCKNCRATELQCTYLAVLKKKGPKGRRTVREFKPVPIQRPRIFDQAPRPESLYIIQPRARDQLPNPHALDQPRHHEAVLDPVATQTEEVGSVDVAFHLSPLLSEDLSGCLLHTQISYHANLGPRIDLQYDVPSWGLSAALWAHCRHLCTRCATA